MGLVCSVKASSYIGDITKQIALSHDWLMPVVTAHLTSFANIHVKLLGWVVSFISNMNSLSSVLISGFSFTSLLGVEETNCQKSLNLTLKCNL